MARSGLKPIIVPSMLSSDFARLGEESRRMLDCGADWLHLDVMDGHFVPNITIGAPVVRCVRQSCAGFLDCHLMVEHPLRWAEDFAKAGCNMYTFHVEAKDNVAEVIALAKRHGMQVGLAVKPGTPVEAVLPFCDSVDMVLIMTVEPGFGGQKFMAHMLPKVKRLRELRPNLNIQVDGGLALGTVEAAAEAGANVIVAGTSIFAADSSKDMIEKLRHIVAAAIEKC